MNINSTNYLNKYLKYKKKYLDLKNNRGGATRNDLLDSRMESLLENFDSNNYFQMLRLMNVNISQLSLNDQEYLNPEQKEIISEGFKKAASRELYLMNPDIIKESHEEIYKFFIEDNFKNFFVLFNPFNVNFIKRGSLPSEIKATKRYLNYKKEMKLNQNTDYVKYDTPSGIRYYYDLNNNLIHELKNIKDLNVHKLGQGLSNETSKEEFTLTEINQNDKKFWNYVNKLKDETNNLKPYEEIVKNINEEKKISRFQKEISRNRELQNAINVFFDSSYDWKKNPKKNDLYYNLIFNLLEKLKNHKDDRYPWNLIKKIINSESDYKFEYFKSAFSNYQNQKKKINTKPDESLKIKNPD